MVASLIIGILFLVLGLALRTGLIVENFIDEVLQVLKAFPLMKYRLALSLLSLLANG